MPARVLAAATLLVWAAASSGGACFRGDERAAVRQRLQALVDLVNTRSGAAEGLPAAAQAARVAEFFTDDVEISLGEGTAPIVGREMLMAMVLRLQPRTAEYRVAVVDVSVTMERSGDAAAVDLTAEFIRRVRGGSRAAMDAREFALALRRDGDEWRISRVVAVATLK